MTVPVVIENDCYKLSVYEDCSIQLETDVEKVIKNMICNLGEYVNNAVNVLKEADEVITLNWNEFEAIPEGYEVIVFPDPHNDTGTYIILKKYGEIILQGHFESGVYDYTDVVMMLLEVVIVCVDTGESFLILNRAYDYYDIILSDGLVFKYDPKNDEDSKKICRILTECIDIDIGPVDAVACMC